MPAALAIIHASVPSVLRWRCTRFRGPVPAVPTFASKSFRMRNLIVVGASGHARVVLDLVRRAGTHRVVGLVDRDTPLGTDVLGYPVVGRTDTIAACAAAHGADSFIVAIGDNAARERVTREIQAAAPHLELASAIHPTAEIGGSVVIGAGTVIMAGVVINVLTRIGVGCIVNTRAAIDHDGVLGDFVSIGPGCVIAGTCSFGHGATLGIGAVVVQQRTIGERAVVGAGATVLRDIPAYTVAYGTPARVQRELPTSGTPADRSNS